MTEAEEKPIPTPFLSVIVPTYNRPIQLPDVLRSLDCQTFKDFELIVSDDCSDIRYADSVVKAMKHPTTLIRQQENRGEVQNVYTAMTLVNGKYVYIIHDDDYLVDCRVFEEAQYFLKKYNPTVLMCAHQTTCIKTGEVKRYYSECDGWITSTFNDRILQSNPTIVGGFFVRRDVLAEMGYINDTLKYFSDWDLLIRLSTHDQFNIYYWRRIIINYNINSTTSQSVRLQKDSEAKEKELGMIADLVKEIKQYREEQFHSISVDTHNIVV